MNQTNNRNLKRVIVDFKKLNNDILELLVSKYHDGYDDDNIITFKNQHNEMVECVEVRTEDTIYLVKVSTRLADAMDDFTSIDEDYHKAIDDDEE